MAQAGDTSLTRELRFALDGYVDARLGWRQIVESLKQEVEAREGRQIVLDPNNEVHLYQHAQRWVETSYVGDLPENRTFDEIADRARRYVTEVGRLRDAVERMEQHLKNISEEVEEN
jgi:hypothetical protein